MFIPEMNYKPLLQNKLTLRHAMVLEKLLHSNGVPIRDLRDEFLHSVHLDYVIDRLVELNFVTRKRANNLDRRLVHITLTDQGKEFTVKNISQEARNHETVIPEAAGSI